MRALGKSWTRWAVWGTEDAFWPEKMPQWLERFPETVRHDIKVKKAGDDVERVTQIDVEKMRNSGGGSKG